MSAIRVVDPATVESTTPVTGLVERPVLRAGDRRLLLVAVDTDAAWHRREGAAYGWVRAGDGRLAYATEADPIPLEPGDFFRIPAGTVHRFVAGERRPELLIGVDAATTTRADPPMAVDAGAAPAVVGADELAPAVETPALIRETPFPDAEALLLRVRAAGGAAAGWHHHGDNVYFGYAVDGPSETEYGPDGDRVARIDPGECFAVPPGLVHRDTNPTDRAHTGIVWLFGGPPWVVNVDGPA